MTAKAEKPYASQANAAPWVNDDRRAAEYTECSSSRSRASGTSWARFWLTGRSSCQMRPAAEAPSMTKTPSSSSQVSTRAATDDPSTGWRTSQSARYQNGYASRNPICE